MMTETRSVYHTGNGKIHVRPHSRSLAIVGSHPKGLERVPWDDQTVEIWLFNESAMKVEKYPRWDALIQIHAEDVYSSPQNWVNKDHWEWLQKDHKKPIFMQKQDPRVPNSIEYPLDEILALTPYRYLRSSPAMALALAIYLGYPRISLYGSELTSNTEYAYQATNLAFWIGYAHGKGIDFDLQCWETEFNQRIYGYEGELQLGKEYFDQKVKDVNQAIFANRNTASQLDRKLEEAMIKADFQEVGILSQQMDNFYINAGTADSTKEEAVRYFQADTISRQEFERRAAQAQRDGDELRTQHDHLNGIVEYTWNAWNSSKSAAAKDSFMHFLKQRNSAAYNMGAMLGKFNENIHYLGEYDKRITAAGGIRALGQAEGQKATQ